MTDTESLLLSCSQEILHDYYEKNEITLLLASYTLWKTNGSSTPETAEPSWLLPAATKNWPASAAPS